MEVNSVTVGRDTQKRWAAEDAAAAADRVDTAVQQEANEILDGVLRQIGELVPSIGFARARDFVLGRLHQANQPHGGGFHPVEDAERYEKITRSYIAALDRLGLPDDLGPGAIRTDSSQEACLARHPSQPRVCAFRKGHSSPHSWEGNFGG